MRIRVLAALSALALQAQAPQGDAQAEVRAVVVRVLHGDRPAPPDTEVRLFKPFNRNLCGTSQYHAAPMQHPDAQGWVIFETAEEIIVRIEATHPALDTVYLEPKDLKDLSKPLTLRFPAGAKVSGKVLDAKGRPVPRARVLAVSRGPDPGGDGKDRAMRMSAVRPEDGRFEFLNLPPGRWLLLADAYDDAWSGGVEVSAGTEGLELKLAARLWLAGNVVDAAGKPVQEPWMHLQVVGLDDDSFPGPFAAPRTQEAYAALARPGVVVEPKAYRKSFGGDALGRFETFVALRGPVEVWADGPEGSCTTSQREVVSAAREAMELRLPAPASLAAKVLDPSGRPATNVRLVLRSRTKVPYHYDCQERTIEPAVKDGRIEVSSLPSHFDSLELRSGMARPFETSLELAPGKKVDLGEIKLLAGGRLRGIVKGPEGKPKEMAKIMLGFGDGEARQVAHTNEYGFFSVNGLPAGPVRVFADLYGRARSDQVEVKVVAGRQVDVDLALQPVEPDSR
ncbi:MAG TPA: carboxypeptidase-like regulatory domain-containing protein [Propionicimonas sp.]|jgi:hypothetical protein